MPCVFRALLARGYMTVDGSRVSVIIPTLNEEAALPAAIRSARDAGADEVIVADGGSSDGTMEAARRLADIALSCAPCRAAQMNAGARASSGDALLFLHADTLLPPDAARAVRDALRGADVAGGAFSVRLGVSPGASAYSRAILGLTGGTIGLRARIFRSYTGDQAMFARREAFDRAGGFPEVPLMEDVIVSRLLARLGRTVLLPQRVTTSARRWESRGPLRTILLMWALRLAHLFGMSPSRCAEKYGRSRRG